MGGQDAYATGASAGNGLRHQPFLAPKVCIIVGAGVVEWRGGDPCGRPRRFASGRPLILASNINKEEILSSRTILDRLKEGIVQGAEGYVFELERRGYIKAGPYVPEVVLDFPEAVKELHREFLRAGSEVMVALTYYAHREKLKDVGRENDLERMNRQAVRLANEVAREGDALVAGNICNTWAYDPHNVKETSRIVRAMYEEQLTWAIEEGIDFVIA